MREYIFIITIHIHIQVISWIIFAVLTCVDMC